MIQTQVLDCLTSISAVNLTTVGNVFMSRAQVPTDSYAQVVLVTIPKQRPDLSPGEHCMLRAEGLHAS